MAGDWESFGAALEAVGALLDPPGRRPEPTGSDWYGSSDEFAAEIRAHWRDLAVPEREIIALINGPNAWRPELELPPPPGESCSWCGSPPTPPPGAGPGIAPGSLLYCPKCARSGFEDRLALQRKLAGRPPREPGRRAPALPVPTGPGRAGTPATGPRPLTRRERRARRFAAS
jgi:hypothetical protein